MQQVKKKWFTVCKLKPSNLPVYTYTWIHVYSSNCSKLYLRLRTEFLSWNCHQTTNEEWEIIIITLWGKFISKAYILSALKLSDITSKSTPSPSSYFLPAINCRTEYVCISVLFVCTELHMPILNVHHSSPSNQKAADVVELIMLCCLIFGKKSCLNMNRMFCNVCTVRLNVVLDYASLLSL